jgi:hypothetical protein
LSRHHKPFKLTTSIDSSFRLHRPGGVAGQRSTLNRKPARLTFFVAGSAIAAAAIGASLVTIWPAAASVQRAGAAPVGASHTVRDPALTATAAPGAGWLLAQKSAAVIAEETGRRPVISAAAVEDHDAVLTGKGSSEHAAARRADANTAAPAHQVTQGTALAAPVVSGSPQQIALAMLGNFGWSADQFSCLNALWARESGWNPSAMNAGSGAYGIPQALPGSKMASAGPDWQTDAATQIRWGLGYIQATYGSPCGAWGHEEAYGWY